MQSLVKCPQCNSDRVFRAGFRYLANGKAIQRWLCAACSSRFSQKTLKKSLNNSFELRQICVSGKMKNLSQMREKERLSAEVTKEIQQQILNFILHCRKEGLHDGSIRTYNIYLRLLVKSGANLLEPESVKETLTRKEEWSDNTKALVTYTYTKFLETMGKSWKAPKYRIKQKIPFLPTEQELDTLICGSRKKMATLLTLLKETGMRSGEAFLLKWIDIDFHTQTLTLNETEKSGEPRAFKISSTLAAMLKSMQTENEKVFTGNVRQARATFRAYRKRMSFKLKNPRLLRITFHSFRHWKASMLYHQTKDILFVKEALGHRNIKNTLIYTHLISFEKDEWHSKTAKTTEEAQKLVESGFEYVCTTPEYAMLFRKRK